MSAKMLVCKPITAREANAVIKRLHYSGGVVINSQLHIGVFYQGSLEGAMQLGPPLDKRKVLGLVAGTPWNGMMELNRMAFSDRLPRNSESRAMSVLMRLLRKHSPNLDWILSYADATQCGDGTIYRAAGFVLSGIKENKSLARTPDGTVIHEITAKMGKLKETLLNESGGTWSWSRFCKAHGLEVLPGYQLRYIYFLNPEARKRLAVPEIPYSELKARGIKMYKGKRAGSTNSGAPADQAGGGGASPTPALQEGGGR